MLRTHPLASDSFVEMIKQLAMAHTALKLIKYLRITEKRCNRLINTDASPKDIRDLQGKLIKAYCKTDFPKYQKIREESNKDGAQTCRYKRKPFIL